ncbi:hypothetical protein ABEV74_22500 [Paenibacillus cisolokensis]|uniref:GNAT family N-acetyltransferase, cg3035/Rv0428c family n=1 Tax=Paenibacillus cisolokensis TaxID=1658519 RepID=UPI003D2A7D26
MAIRHDKIDELFRLEERCLNAWPGLHTVLHEGWQLRFSGGYTKRANSVIPYLCANEQNRLAERIAYCESAYAAAGLAPVFKLVSFAEPEWLDRELEKRGYGIVEPSGVWTVGLANIAPPETDSAAFFPSASGEWLDAFAALSGLDESALRIAVRLLSGPCLHRGFFLIREQKVPVAFICLLVPPQSICAFLDGNGTVLTPQGNRRRHERGQEAAGGNDRQDGPLE